MAADAGSADVYDLHMVWEFVYILLLLKGMMLSCTMFLPIRATVKQIPY